jgi:hypothetical protein
MVMWVSGGGDGCGRDIAVGGDAEADGFGAAGGANVGLGDFVVGGGEADLQSSASPVQPSLGLGDAGQEVVADLFQAAPLVRGDPQEWAPDAGVLVDAAGGVCPSAVA